MLTNVYFIIHRLDFLYLDRELAPLFVTPCEKSYLSRPLMRPRPGPKSRPAPRYGNCIGGLIGYRAEFGAMTKTSTASCLSYAFHLYSRQSRQQFRTQAVEHYISSNYFSLDVRSNLGWRMVWPDVTIIEIDYIRTGVLKRIGRLISFRSRIIYVRCTKLSKIQPLLRQRKLPNVHC